MAILLIQLFEQSPPVVSALEEKVGEMAEVSTYTIDNFSDSSSLGYAKLLLKESRHVCVGLWEHSAAPFTSVQPIMNEVIKHKTKCQLITNSVNARVKKISTIVPTITVSGEHELISTLRRLSTPD